jgi:hypothetical protein
MDATTARRLLGPDKILGVSVKTPEGLALWSTSKVNLPGVIDFRALCCANLATYPLGKWLNLHPADFRGVEPPGPGWDPRRVRQDPRRSRSVLNDFIAAIISQKKNRGSPIQFATKITTHLLWEVTGSCKCVVIFVEKLYFWGSVFLRNTRRDDMYTRCASQGYLAQKKLPPPLGPT